MRLWTLHPKYLDSKGLVAAWREGLLAKKALEGHTIGYKNHPQLIRFKNSHHPIDAINAYLANVLNESFRRGYKFDSNKINMTRYQNIDMIMVTKGQVEYEWLLLLNKLKRRNEKAYSNVIHIVEIEVNGIFKIIEGNVAEWENVKDILDLKSLMIA